MTSRKNIFILRLINTLIFAILIYIQYNSNFTLKIDTANPVLPIALLIPICMFCSELTAAISGLLVGIFMDTVAATPQGFNAISLMILGLASALIIKHLFNIIKSINLEARKVVLNLINTPCLKVMICLLTLIWN